MAPTDWSLVSKAAVPIITYAAGVVQTTVIDYSRRKKEHRRHLRLFLSEVRRLSTYTTKYNWTRDGLNTDTVPVVAPPLDAYSKALADVDWSISDPGYDDHMHEHLAGITNDVGVLLRLQEHIVRFQFELDGATAERRPSIDEALLFFSSDFDKVMDNLAGNLARIRADLEVRNTLAQPFTARLHGATTKLLGRR